MAQSESSGSNSASIVAIVAIVMLVVFGFFILRGGLGRGGGGSAAPGVKGGVEINVPNPAPGK